MVGDIDGATTNGAGVVPPRPRLGRGQRISYVKIYLYKMEYVYVKLNR